MIDGTIFKFILTFDLAKETFGEFALPTHSNEEYTFISRPIAVDGGSSLAVINYARERETWEPVLSIWVMKDYGITDSWSKVFYCDNRCYGGRIFDILALTSNVKVLFNSNIDDIFLLDPIKESIELVGHQFHSQAYASSHVDSLFLLNKEPHILSF